MILVAKKSSKFEENSKINNYSFVQQIDNYAVLCIYVLLSFFSDGSHEPTHAHHAPAPKHDASNASRSATRSRTPRSTAWPARSKFTRSCLPSSHEPPFPHGGKSPKPTYANWAYAISKPKSSPAPKPKYEHNWSTTST